MTVSTTLGGGVGAAGTTTGVLVGGNVGLGVRVGRRVAVGEGSEVAVAVAVAGGAGVFVGSTGVCVGTGVFVGSGVLVGSVVGVGNPMKTISKLAFRAPLSKVSMETDLKPFKKNSIGCPIKRELDGDITRL